MLPLHYFKNRAGGGYLLGGTDSSYRLNFAIASTDPRMWILVMLKTLGQWGNVLFVICSAWFLCLSDRVSLNKVVKMVLEVFVVSVVLLALFLLLGLRPFAKDIVKCLFPITFSNNWFITCYLLLYVIHPGLNWIFERLGKRGHAAAALSLFALYMLLPSLHAGHFYANDLFVMIAVYAVVAYGRFYLPEVLRSGKANRGAFLGGIFGAALLVVLLELIGVHVDAFSDKVLHFCRFGDPLLFLSAFGLFNLLRGRPFTNAKVNRASGLMLLVYLIHENYVFKLYVRPCVWPWIYENLGYGLLFVWLAIFSFALFAVSLIAAVLYAKTLGKGVEIVAPRLERSVRKAGGSLIGRICSLK